ncbi:phosphoribosylformylglycinamidine synthase, partial [Candidatus Erwinia dacicola]
RWQQDTEQREMTSPLSLVITAFARVEDVRKTVTPQLKTVDNALLLIDLGKGINALGATALSQVYRQLGDKPADVRDAQQLAGFYHAIQALVAEGKLLAYHDRSDGGLLVTLAEMAFTGHCGVAADIATLGRDSLAALFNEELGAVIQVAAADLAAVEQVFAAHDLAECVHVLGKAVEGDRFTIISSDSVVYSESRTTLRTWWAETTWQMQRLRDNPSCADQEHDTKKDDRDPGLNVSLTFKPQEDIAAPYIATGARPKVAVLREQGV